MNPNPPVRWQPPSLSFGECILTSLQRSLTGSLPVSIVYFLVRVLIRSFQPEPSGSFTDLLAPAGMLFFIAWLFLFALFLIGSSRSWADRVFTVSGFLATFFGLGILSVFFFQLAFEVGKWFEETPQLVAVQNAINAQERLKLDDLKGVQDNLKADLDETEKNRAEELNEATSPEEKQAVNQRYDKNVERVKNDLIKTQAEIKIITESSMRPDQSRSAILWYFLTSSPSSLPQDAGISPALWGSVWLGIITILFSVPVGVGAALYLEEYRQEGWLARIIQININNLAGVPSVVFGILGGFVFVYLFKQIQLAQGADSDIAPRNLLGGGLTLGLLTLPMVIVSAQEAIRSVPISLRQGAYALGATKWQVMWTIVLPMARPGILTGTILSLSRAVGEAAPLVLFGAQLFVDQNPSLLSRFTALPLQIFNWCDRPAHLVTTAEGQEYSVDIWKYNAAVASTVLLLVLLSMNALAIILRNRAQKKMRY